MIQIFVLFMHKSFISIWLNTIFNQKKKWWSFITFNFFSMTNLFLFSNKSVLSKIDTMVSLQWCRTKIFKCKISFENSQKSRTKNLNLKFYFKNDDCLGQKIRPYNRWVFKFSSLFLNLPTHWHHDTNEVNAFVFKIY